MDPTLIKLLEPLVTLAHQAGQKILEIYEKKETALVQLKENGSPLTKADCISNQIILDGLAALTPTWPILSEESADVPYSERAEWQRYWLVDPLDGTKEFIQRTGDFTVNIALIENHHPVMGIVYSPTLGISYYACQDHGAYRRDHATHISDRICTQVWKGGPVRVISSRRHGVEELQSFLEELPDYNMTLMGSSLKFCLIAEGAADIYPRFGLTSEWDTAAAQCVLEQAGGAVLDTYGLPLQYNTRDSLLNPHFLAVGDRDHAWIHYLKKQ